MTTALNVRNLRTHFYTSAGVVKSVDGVSFQLEKGKTLGLVGESGCGKSVTAMSILRLIDPPGRIVAGEVLLNGVDLLQLTAREMRGVRGARISMIYQEPMTALNPVYEVGEQISEALRAHERIDRKSTRLNSSH